MASRRQGSCMNAFHAQGKPEELAPYDAARMIYGTIRAVTLKEITIDPSIRSVSMGWIWSAFPICGFPVGGRRIQDPIIVFQDGKDLVLPRASTAVRLRVWHWKSGTSEDERIEIARSRLRFALGDELQRQNAPKKTISRTGWSCPRATSETSSSAGSSAGTSGAPGVIVRWRRRWASMRARSAIGERRCHVRKIPHLK